MSKILKIITVSIVIVVIVATIVLLGVFLPVRGAHNDGEYWSEYDKFLISDVETLEMTGETFTILQLTDLHYHLPHKTAETDDIVKKLVKESSPDMIVITGDSVYGPTNVMYTKHLAKLMDSFAVPWAVVYGNHDDEGKADKYWMGNVYENSQYGLYRNGPYNIGGTGNYIVNILKDDAPVYSVVMMDSNRETRINGAIEYGAFTSSQVAWYSWAAKGLKNNGYDKSMMFFHIPFPEYLTAYEQWGKNGFDPDAGFGHKGEDVCCSPYNPGMFTKILEENWTTHTFCGHDHVNDFSVEYQGVTLTYGTKSSRQFYYDESLIGGTVITVDSESNVEVSHKYVGA